MAGKTTTSRKTTVSRKTTTARANGAKSKAAKPKRQQPETLRLRSIQPTFTVNDIQQSDRRFRV